MSVPNARILTPAIAGQTLAFIASLALYLCCLDSGASLWDCPEYVATAFMLEVGHPPGNPAWTLMANVASHLAGSPARAAFAINLTSALATALAAALLFRICLCILEGWILRRHPWTAATAAWCGAMCFAWCDSAIFSAVETEVYALSIFFTALMVWLMLRWARARRRGDRTAASRLLLAEAYLTGLSLGVHELNLLAITAMALIYVFTLHPRHATLRAWGGVAVSFVIIGGILLFWFPFTISLAGTAERYATASLGMPYGTGAAAGVILLLCLLTLAALSAFRHKLHRAGMVIASTAFLTLGSCVYLLIPIRAAANPPMSQVAPSHPSALTSYVKRDQYGSKPLFLGQTPYSAPLATERTDSSGRTVYDRVYRKAGRRLYVPFREGAVVADRCRLLTPADSAANAAVAAQGHGYLVAGYTYTYAYAPELDMWFSRLTSGNSADIESYADWGGMTPESMREVVASNAVDSLGNPVRRLSDPADPESPRRGTETLRPTYLQQLRYLLGYQAGYMYFRYLLWNFSGRQNNYPAAGEIDHGNFITGIPPIDNAMLGDQTMLPDELGSSNPGHNVYFMVPLLLGIFGAVGALRTGRRGRRASAVVLALFLMTGLAIVFYLNQDPRQPRERDYAFLGSYLAFAIWIAMGMGILLRAAWRRGKGAAGCFALLCAAVPFWMLCQNADDHRRSGRDSAGSVARNMLEPLEHDAILFVDGDNTTFPLWYAQEVLGVRRDVTVVSMAYLSTPWYAPQLMADGPERKGLRLTARPADLLYDAFPMARFDHDDTTADAVEALRGMYAVNPGTSLPRLRAGRLRLAVPGGDSITVDLAGMTGGSHTVMRQQLIVLDILATNAASPAPRPVYWQRNLPAKAFAGLRDSTRTVLMSRRLVSDADALSEGVRSMEMMVPAGRRGIYVEPYAGNSVSWQRMSAVLLSRRLMEAGRCGEALRTAEKALELWPLEEWPAATMNVDGETVNEALALASVLETYGHDRGDSVREEKGRRIREAELRRIDGFRRYRNSLSPARRAVLSAETRSLLSADTVR